jgi:hypothetical protein
MADDPEKTPDPTPDPEPEKRPDPEPENPQAAHAHCKPEIDALSSRVTELETALNTALTFKPDSRPVRRPWTHRGGKD